LLSMVTSDMATCDSSRRPNEMLAIARLG
jgi:hypothetical protein